MVNTRASGSRPPSDSTAFLDFIRRQHVDPQAQANLIREKIFTLYQGASQQPLDFFQEWDTLHRQVSARFTTKDDDLAWNFWRRLQFNLRMEITKQGTPLEDARAVALEAQRLWNADSTIRTSARDYAERKANRKRARDGYQKSGGFQTPPNQRPPSFPSSRGNRHQTPRADSGPLPTNRRADTPSIASETGTSANAIPVGSSRACYDCGQVGHFRGNPICPKPSDRPTKRRAVVQAVNTEAKEEFSDSELSENYHR